MKFSTEQSTTAFFTRIFFLKNENKPCCCDERCGLVENYRKLGPDWLSIELSPWISLRVFGNPLAF